MKLIRNAGKYPIDSIMSEQKIKGNKFHIRKPDFSIKTFCGYPIPFDGTRTGQFTILEHESVCIKCQNRVKAFGKIGVNNGKNNSLGYIKSE